MKQSIGRPPLICECGTCGKCQRREWNRRDRERKRKAEMRTILGQRTKNLDAWGRHPNTIAAQQENAAKMSIAGAQASASARAFGAWSAKRLIALREKWRSV